MLLVAGMAAGAMNAGAGGGSFLTYPALIAVGVPPIAANATSAVSQLPGYVASAVSYRRDIEPVGGAGVAAMMGVAMAGGVLGAVLLLLTPASAFQAAVPWLMLVATGLFAFGRRIAAALSRAGAHGVPGMLLGLFAASVYGGYFSGGYGILVMAHLAMFGARNLNVTNGVKNLVSAGLTVIAAIAYTTAGAVRWPEGLLMMAGAAIGGYWGARLIRRAPEAGVRAAVILIGLSMAGLFFWRGA
jgi:uncharacterized membrane protein YfcA